MVVFCFKLIIVNVFPIFDLNIGIDSNDKSITYDEVGGKGKTAKQIREVDGPAYLVKDDVLYGGKREVPLHLFGFLY